MIWKNDSEEFGKKVVVMQGTILTFD